MIILHVAPIIWRGIGGLRVSIPALVSSQNCLDGVDAALAVTAARPGETPNVDFRIFSDRIAVDRSGRLNLPAPFDRPHLVVFHSTYIPVHAVIAAKLRQASIPYILCPRGGMTRYAQRFRWWKKRLANLLFFNKLVAGAAAVNCLTDGEAEVSDGWNRPLFVVGNGSHLPPQTSLAAPGRSSHLRLVFIGRLHVQYKGLDMLLHACRLVQSELRQAGAVVELHGPDCNGSTKILTEQIARLHLEDLVTLHGPVMDEAKASVLRGADVFLHPSRSEGHPMAVLEALAYGVPCLLTPVTNVADEVVHAGAGWKVEPSPLGIAAGLTQIVTAQRTRLQQAGLAARRLAVDNYGWDKIALRSIEAYRKCAA